MGDYISKALGAMMLACIGIGVGLTITAIGLFKLAVYLFHHLNWS